VRDSSEMNGNVPVEALLRLGEDMVGDGGRYSGGMKPPPWMKRAMVMLIVETLSTL